MISFNLVSAFVGTVVGTTIWQCTNTFILLGSQFPSLPFICAHIVIGVSSGMYNAFLWILPSFFVSILLKNFHDKCVNVYEEFIQNCNNCLKLYEKLSESFENYFFAIYSATQLNSIFFVFITLSSLFKKKDIANADLILCCGSFIQMSSGIYCLIIGTGAIDQAFQDLQYLRRQAQEKLLYSSVKAERQHLKFLLQRIEMLGPMNGRGYFGIDKTTLTSMLSVRYISV